MKANEVIDADQYIIGFPEDIQKLLQELRSIIKKAAPDAQEVISYSMPAYKYHGMLAYFAGYQHHIGFYPMPPAITKFKKKLYAYKTTKATVQFPVDKPLPSDLITKMVEFRVQENLEKQALRKQKKKRTT